MLIYLNARQLGIGSQLASSYPASTTHQLRDIRQVSSSRGMLLPYLEKRDRGVYPTELLNGSNCVMPAKRLMHSKHPVK